MGIANYFINIKLECSWPNGAKLHCVGVYLIIMNSIMGIVKGMDGICMGQAYLYAGWCLYASPICMGAPAGKLNSIIL